MPNDLHHAETTDDAVLGGRLRLRQPRRGHRVGHDAILLAAATAARAGDHVVDLGAGVGAAGLAVAVRVPGVTVTLVEIDPQLCALAQANAHANDLADRVDVVRADVTAPGALAAAGHGPGSADGVLMNPPFHDVTRQNVSPDPGRRLAHAAPPQALRSWTGSAAQLLAADGILTLIWRADGLADVERALAAQFGALTILPVHGKAGQPAIRVLVRAIKGSAAPSRHLPALVLNDLAGRPTAQAESILRAGAALPLAKM